MAAAQGHHLRRSANVSADGGRRDCMETSLGEEQGPGRCPGSDRRATGRARLALYRRLVRAARYACIAGGNPAHGAKSLTQAGIKDRFMKPRSFLLLQGWGKLRHD